MGLSGPRIGDGCSVARDHRTGAPPGETHQVALVAPFGEPHVGEAVAKLMDIDMTDASLLGPSLGYLAHPRICDRPFFPSHRAGELAC